MSKIHQALRVSNNGQCRQKESSLNFKKFLVRTEFEMRDVLGVIIFDEVSTVEQK